MISNHVKNNTSYLLAKVTQSFFNILALVLKKVAFLKLIIHVTAIFKDYIVAITVDKTLSYAVGRAMEPLNRHQTTNNTDN